MVTKIFSMDEKTVKRLEDDAEKLHLGKSAFLRFLVWKWYHDQKKINNERQEGCTSG